MPINGREKGKRYERQTARMWEHEMGGEVERSSYVNKKLDNAGVDLVGTDPFSIQCKAVERSMDIHQVLADMPQDEKYNVVFHKRNNKGQIACLDIKDFMELISKLRQARIL
tara:strand:- start:501 stop:836 length:336 start_codon:yes stop_codon:yes gene_type:complete